MTTSLTANSTLSGASVIRCRCGILMCSALCRNVLAGLIALSLIQTTSVSAESLDINNEIAATESLESESSEEVSEPLPTSLAFETTLFDNVREGYVELRWNPVESATEYVIVENDGTKPYRGSVEQALVSGLSNGTYSFEVQAYDKSGKLLAFSTMPAVVNVDHWPLSQAMVAFMIGLIIFVALISIIVHGALTADKSSGALDPAGTATSGTTEQAR